MMFAGVVAVLCPTGLSQAHRKILAEGLTSNGATVLDYRAPSTGVPAASLPPNASQLLMKAAKSRGKNMKRNQAKDENRADGGRGVGARDETSPTLVICHRDAFLAGRVSTDMEGIFSRYPPPQDGSPVKVVSDRWLSECLRLESLQKIGAAELLETVTFSDNQHETSVAKRSKIDGRNGNFHSGDRQSVGDQNATDQNATDHNTNGSTTSDLPKTWPNDGKTTGNSTSKSSWGCLAPPSAKPSVSSSSKPSSSPASSAPPRKNPWSMSTRSPFMSQSSSGGGSSSSKRKVGVGPGPGDGKGPGMVVTEPVYRDGSVSDELRGRWEELAGGSVLRWVPKAGTRVSTHIVAFDMDGTLIKSKSGKKFTDEVGDWELLHSSVVPSLRAWHDRGYKVAIISNQLGVGKGKVTKGQLQTKVESVLDALKVPVEAYLACEDDYYRKPRPGCWDLVAKIHNGNMEVVTAECLYVGDAAGRPKHGTHKKDFSAGDLKLALNVGIPFQTPEQFFMRSQHGVHKDRSLAVLGFNPSSLSDSASVSLENLAVPNGGGEGVLEVVVLVGPPAAGKSTLCKERLSGHVRVNQDELGSLDKCMRVAKANLKDGRSVVIDATNPGKHTRAGWIALAHENGARVRCIYLTTPKEACFHLNAFRGSNPWSPEEERRIVPDIAIHSWFKNMHPVNSKEGFSEVIRVPFVPRSFGEGDETARKQEKLLFMYLLPN